MIYGIRAIRDTTIRGRKRKNERVRTNDQVQENASVQARVISSRRIIGEGGWTRTHLERNCHPQTPHFSFFYLSYALWASIGRVHDHIRISLLVRDPGVIGSTDGGGPGRAQEVSSGPGKTNLGDASTRGGSRAYQGTPGRRLVREFMNGRLHIFYSVVFYRLPFHRVMKGLFKLAEHPDNIQYIDEGEIQHRCSDQS